MCRKPQRRLHPFLLDGKPRPFADIDQQTSGNLEVPDKAGVDPHHRTIRLVHDNRCGQAAGYLFETVAGGNTGITLVVEQQDGASIDNSMAWTGEPAELQQARDRYLRVRRMRLTLSCLTNLFANVFV